VSAFSCNPEKHHCTCPAEPVRDDPYYQCPYCERQQEDRERLTECTNCGADVDTTIRSQCDECGSLVA
jgi:DNA-directed RNA polymerase subunit RPC12/RpoP